MKQIRIDKQTPALEKFLGRKFKQEEMYDTMHFISKKKLTQNTKSIQNI